MPRIKVNKVDVCQFENSINKFQSNLSELDKAVNIIKSVISAAQEKQLKVRKKITSVDIAINKISVSINKLGNKINEIRIKITKKEAQLAATPKQIMTIKGPIRNPIYCHLLAELKGLKMYLKSLESLLMSCKANKIELSNNKNILTNIDSTLVNSINEFESLIPEVHSIKEKLYANSEKAITILKKIIDAIDRYMSVRAPVTDSFLTKNYIVSGVDSHDIILGENGSFWTKEMGNYGEMRTSVEFRAQGFMEMTKSPVSLNEKLKHGIDHIFYKDDKFYIVDSKSGPGAHLEAKTATGPQLSDSWIDARLDDAVGKEAADIIREKMIFESDSALRIVSKVDVGKKTIYGLVDEDGKIIKEAQSINELFN